MISEACSVCARKLQRDSGINLLLRELIEKILPVAHELHPRTKLVELGKTDAYFSRAEKTAANSLIDIIQTQHTLEQCLLFDEPACRFRC
jgi:hypothetical protein